MGTILSSVIEDIKKRKNERETETVKDSIIASMAKAGAKPETLDLVGKIKAETPQVLTSAIKDIQDIMLKTPQGAQAQATLEADKQRALNEAEVEKKDIESSQKLGTAVKRLQIINQQFNEALPTGANTELEQRFAGPMAAWGAKTGVAPNPKLLAIMTNSRPIAINLVRLFGEVGNLSETEQKGALDVVDQAKLTETERLEKVKQFAEYALAGASTKSIDFLKKQPDVVETIKNLGIKVPGINDGKKSEKASNPKDEADQFLASFK